MPPYDSPKTKPARFGVGEKGISEGAGGREGENACGRVSIEESCEAGGSENPHCRHIKCVLVGDGAVGKTSLIVSYTTNGYPSQYVPTAFDNYSVLVTVDKMPINLQLCDTAGQDDFNSLRPLCYPDTHIFLLCFSIADPSSFYSIKEFWVPEISTYVSEPNFMLIGTQCDLRSDATLATHLAKEGESFISQSTAEFLAHSIGAQAYIECSALTQERLKEVFDTTILLCLKECDKRRKRETPERVKLSSIQKLKEKLLNKINSHQHGQVKSQSSCAVEHLPTSGTKKARKESLQHFEEPSKNAKPETIPQNDKSETLLEGTKKASKSFRKFFDRKSKQR